MSRCSHASSVYGGRILRCSLEAAAGQKWCALHQAAHQAEVEERRERVGRVRPEPAVVLPVQELVLQKLVEPKPRRARRDIASAERRFDKALGQRVRDRRQEIRMSQRKLAKKMQSWQPNISDLESGETGASALTICKLADALGCSSDWLLGRVVE